MESKKPGTRSKRRPGHISSAVGRLRRPPQGNGEERQEADIVNRVKWGAGRRFFHVVNTCSDTRLDDNRIHRPIHAAYGGLLASQALIFNLSGRERENLNDKR